MAKSDKKIHEHRMSGARWILNLVKEEGIEQAEQELLIRGSSFIPLEIGAAQRKKLERSITNQLYPTIMIAVLGILADKYEFSKEKLEEFQQNLDHFSDILFEIQSDNTPYVEIHDYEHMLLEEYGIQIRYRNQG